MSMTRKDSVPTVVYSNFVSYRQCNRDNMKHETTQAKLDAYLRSLGLYVEKKLCFFVPALPKVMKLLVYRVTVFCLGMPDMQVSHVYIERELKNSMCYVVKWG